MRAFLRLELRRTDGGLIAVREAHNSVLRSGASLLADMFALKSTGITHMAVGTSDTPETQEFTTTTLTNPTEVQITPDAFQIDPPDPVKRVVRVRVQGTVPAAMNIGTVREAGLVAHNGDTASLYNRVVFAPIDKAADHELTLFWEVGFPFGDLQWLL
jgi:hypothetical protein